MNGEIAEMQEWLDLLKKRLRFALIEEQTRTDLEMRGQLSNVIDG